MTASHSPQGVCGVGSELDHKERPQRWRREIGRGVLEIGKDIGMDFERMRKRDDLKVSGEILRGVCGEGTKDSFLGVGEHKMRAHRGCKA
jgi:hypothetical protein